MTLISIPIVFLAGAASYLFVYFLFVPQTRLIKISAAICFVYVLYDVARIGIYNSPGSSWGFFWLRMSLCLVPVMAACIVLFVRELFLPPDYPGREIRFILIGLAGFFIVAVTTSLWPLTPPHTHTRVSALFDYQLEIYRGNIFDYALFAFILLIMGYALIRLIQLKRNGRIKLQPVPVVCLILFLLFAGHDLIISLSSMPFTFYFADYGLFFLIVAISYINIDIQKFDSAVEPAKDIADYRKSRYKLDLLEGIDAPELEAKLTNLMREEKPFNRPDVSLRMIAGKLEVSYRVLSQLLNEKLGIEFRNYINSYRVEEAKDLLAHNADLSVIEVCYDVGFKSKSAFNNAFKKFTGQSPTEFRTGLK